jgi:hypothetical protein
MSDPRVRFLAGVHDAELAEIVRLLDTPTIHLTGTVTEWRHQVLLYALVDLLGRVFPRLDIAIPYDVPVAAALPPGGRTVGQRLDTIRRRSPLQPQQPGERTITVHIGVGGTGADFYADASEWKSYVGRNPSRLPPPRLDIAVGPLAAACRAGARVFSSLLAPVLDVPTSSSDTYISALTYRSGPDPIDDPDPVPPGILDAMLIGGGSVGGAAAYTFAHEPEVVGQLTVADPQRLEETNPYRSVLATATAATTYEAKVDEIKKALAHHHGLDVDAQPLTITDWEANNPAPKPLPLVLVAVDSLESRERVQDALPLQVVNAAVGPDLVAISGHRTGSGPCMCCLHMPEVLDGNSIKNRLIAHGTGFGERQINELRVRRAMLDDQHLRHIERHRGLARGALSHHAGTTLDDLYNAEILYGETRATSANGVAAAVAAPFVTAQAGVLLAGEALKRTAPAMRPYALSPDGAGIQYRANPYAPEHGYVDGHIPRAAICLCRSVRRLRAVADLYGLDRADLTT